ncbi:MAG: T9SS type A sorting domain-containing protein [Flavobacterium sp.]|nr:T9SS type A sorting domain-containing protein [Flavobacterium sp.]
MVDNKNLYLTLPILDLSNFATWNFLLWGKYINNIVIKMVNNGCDISDIAFPYIKVKIDGMSNSGNTFTNSGGNYNFYTQTGNFTITPEVENPSYFNFSPPNAIINFPIVDNSTQSQNFCVSANGFHPDLEIVLIPIGVARPGFDANYKIVLKNKGNQLLNGIVNLIFDDVRTDFVSSIPVVNNQQTGSLTWNFSNLHPFETRAIDLVLNLNTPIENPPLNSGDILNFIANTSLLNEEGTPLDNTFEFSQTVVNSNDPNDKSCLEGNTITPEDIGKYVHYNINFENVGTADAINIVIKDIIDTTMFDMNSLQLLYASHPVETKIAGNKVEFIFENINLPPSIIDPIGGHGNVLFKIKTLPTLLVGDQIANIANIYFDYNAPIETNEARSTFATLNSLNFVKDQSIAVAPNPAKNNVTVTAKSNIKSIQLFDVQGRILQTILENKNTYTIDISNKSNGIYFLKVTTEIGSSVEKLVKEN